MLNNPSDIAAPSGLNDCAAATKLVRSKKLKSNFEIGVSEEIINCLALMFVNHVVTQENTKRDEGEGRCDLRT